MLSKFIIFAGLLLGLIRLSHAHDPGLSFANVQLINDEIQVKLSFAQKDIESLIGIDTDTSQVGITKQLETENAKQKLQTIMADGIDLSVSREVKSNLISLGESETIKIQLNFQYQRQHQERISLAIPLIAQFPRGHRMHLTVQDSQGEMQVQKILSANSKPIFISAEQIKQTAIFQQYLVEGIRHIWLGFDHILFLITLLLPAVLIFKNQQWYSVAKFLPALMDTLKIVTAFTLAHSVTLGLAVFEIVQLPSRITETAIAFSVLVVAINNLRPIFSQLRWLLALVFGFIHGFGFASVLIELGLPANSVYMSLLGFNLGVEAGQLAIVLFVIPIAYVLRESNLYRQWVFNGGSLAAAFVAAIWMLERASGFDIFAFR